jgi:redox-sensitive bicupin YhaK (pirin superfamily)
MSTANLEASTVHRQVVYRTTGTRHGPVTRLMSPSDLGQLIKPFVFLDLVEGESSFTNGMGLHPHSGIATITLITEGNLRYDDSGNGAGLIEYGGVEWMRAGGGVWHGKEMTAGTSERIQGFQLWIALPPELELAAVDSQYIEASQMPVVGPATVVLGEHSGVHSPIRAPQGVNYLLVKIKAGESWTYTPPQGHESLWLSVSRGGLFAPGLIQAGELVIFEPGHRSVTLRAVGNDTVFIIGSAAPHPYDLALGNYSVHTHPDALRIGEEKIAKIGVRVREYQRSADPSARVPVFE